MFDAAYPYISLGKAGTSVKDPFKKMFYKFRARQRTYLVILEFYSFDVVAIKYCDVKDKNSGNAFSKVFNDLDAFRVIGTCFHIMYHYWRNNRNVSFVFYASLREIKAELLERKHIAAYVVPAFIDQYKRARYAVYRYRMVNLFSCDYFIPVTDRQNCIYALVNRNSQNVMSIIDELKGYLLKMHDIIFDAE